MLLRVMISTGGSFENWAFVISLGLFVTGTVWAVVNPARGLQDRIAGTYLVPR